MALHLHRISADLKLVRRSLRNSGYLAKHGRKRAGSDRYGSGRVGHGGGDVCEKREDLKAIIEWAYELESWV